MVIWLAFRMGQYRVNDHPHHAPQFSTSAMTIKTETRDSKIQKGEDVLRSSVREPNRLVKSVNIKSNASQIDIKRRVEISMIKEERLAIESNRCHHELSF